MLSVCAYLWGDLYSLGDVKLWRDMVERHLTVPHEFVCITDDLGQFDGTGIRAVALKRGAARGPRFCAEKLMTFRPDFGFLVGDRVLVMDLDCIVVGNMDPIVARDEPLVLWRNPSRRPWLGTSSPRALYNSSMVLIAAGARTDVWTRYMKGEAAGLSGDQDWISHVVGPDCPYWDDDDGVYRLGRPTIQGSGPRATLPDNARVVYFPGDEGKPWLEHIRIECPWIDEHRR